MGIPRIGSLVSLMQALNGRPIHRFTINVTAGTPKDNLSASGGTSVAYTLKGGETLLLQGNNDFWYQCETDLTTGMTLLGAKAVLVSAGAPGVIVNLFSADQRVMIDCSTGTVEVKGFQLR